MRVTGVTISREQLDYAQARLQRAGLADRVDLQFRDYRDIEGRYDHIVSIEMIEAVGERYWPDYFAALKRHSVPGGSAIVQAIVIADELFEGYRRHPDFIQTYVFPGGMLLSPSSLREQCRQAGLKTRRGSTASGSTMRAPWRPGWAASTGWPTRSPSWDSTSVSAGCGDITSPIVPQASKPAGLTYCRHTSGIYNCRQQRAGRAKPPGDRKVFGWTQDRPGTQRRAGKNQV